MRIEWDDVALQDRERIFEFLYPLNSLAAEQVDDEIELAVESLLENPEMVRLTSFVSAQLFNNKNI
ncbi:type II toxin-antitoxin system RelE/ParE family toxin [Serratia fonticola]|uniref:type II toxin-antitoxin system RelE/ParE family toxin n=1 Tax=Serratia fonticola TaxID=47917 RepID=UPI000E0FBD56|nr:type II toxin-antitoxin system RelE/ParE family toxin [Serratia fonticola]MBP1038235.1 type II toxin-antitoxin system RelE/ParE family toxin [Serratia fonticola]RDL22030.1 ParE-like toxin of type II ParDE toxin-antitoxin system [Serratia fonticola]